jgi:hypothetical protein
MDVHESVANPAHKPWETAQTMGVDTVSAGFGEESRAERGAIPAHAMLLQNLSQNFLNLLNWNPDHASAILTQFDDLHFCLAWQRSPRFAINRQWARMLLFCDDQAGTNGALNGGDPG